MAHQAGHTVLPDPSPLVMEHPGDARRTGAPLVVVVDALNLLQEALVGLHSGRGVAVPPLVVTAASNGQHATHKGNRMLPFVASDQGVLHFDCLAAKYAEAFFKNAFSSSRRAISRFRRATSASFNRCASVTVPSI